MKLLLQITDSPDSSRPLEHAGAALHIGRDPDGDVSFAGSDQVSFHHARIDLAPRGATLTDLDSTNGTFLNDRRVHGQIALQPGDQVQLGHTGPMLRVVKIVLPEEGGTVPTRKAKDVLDAAPVPGGDGHVRKSPPPLPPPAAREARPAEQMQPSATTRFMLAEVQKTQRTMILAVCAVAAILLLLVGVVWWNSRPGRNQVAAASAASAASTPADLPADATTQPAVRPVEPANGAPPPPVNGGGKTSVAVAPPVNPPPALPAVEALPSERKQVGRYVAPKNEPPSVLLQWQSEPYPWGRLKPESRVSTGNHLVSLPGYRSRIYLDSNVHLTLWGNLPEFSSVPPILESSVMLHVPPPGIDLDFTLDRGRVHLFNFKGKAPATVRVHFHREVWDLTLPNSSTEVVLELWGMFHPDAPFRKEPGGKGPLSCLGVFTKGEATLKAGGRDIRLPNESQLTWTNYSPRLDGPSPWGDMAKWWTSQIDTKPTGVADVAITLKDYSKALEDTDAVLDAVLTKVNGSTDPSEWAVGILFLGAIDAVAPLVNLLEDRRLEVRGATAYALRHWMIRNADQDQELYRTLYSTRFSKEKAEIMMRLLHSFSEKEIADPATYQLLIGYLNHENLAVRELAFYHLANLVPEGTKIPYDPAPADEPKRKTGVEAWKKLIPPGTVPPRPKGPPGAN